MTLPLTMTIVAGFAPLRPPCATSWSPDGSVADSFGAGTRDGHRAATQADQPMAIACVTSWKSPVTKVPEAW